MAFGVLISNNVGSRKSVPVFDSRNPDNGMPQLLTAVVTVAGISGNQAIPTLAGAKPLKAFSLGVYPATANGDMPDVYIVDGRVYWDYATPANPTAVRIAVFT